MLIAGAALLSGGATHGFFLDGHLAWGSRPRQAVSQLVVETAETCRPQSAGGVASPTCDGQKVRFCKGLGGKVVGADPDWSHTRLDASHGFEMLRKLSTHLRRASGVNGLVTGTRKRAAWGGTTRGC